MKIALIIGATGMTGSLLVDQLLDDKRFEKVKIFVRTASGKLHPKLEEYLIDFDTPEKWIHLVTGDVLFSSLGTTLRRAGSKEAQYKVDYTYQYIFAKAASQNGVPVYVLVSAAHASIESGLFYYRMKGKLDRDVQKLSFRQISIIRPGLLEGERKENRTGEKIAIAFSNWLHHFPGLSKLKPIPARTVAKAMINACFQQRDHFQIYTFEEIFLLAKE